MNTFVRAFTARYHHPHPHNEPYGDVPHVPHNVSAPTSLPQETVRGFCVRVLRTLGVLHDESAPDDHLGCA